LRGGKKSSSWCYVGFQALWSGNWFLLWM